MADFLSRATVKGDPWGEAEQAVKHLMTSLPSISKVLIGDRPSGSDLGRLPGSIRLFTNGTELKACLQGKEWLFDGYVVIPKEVGILEALELELQAGKIGWSVVSEHKNTWKKPTH